MHTFWLIAFWGILLLLVLPIPFRLLMYLSGRVVLPKAVIVDESAASIMALIGCVGMYGFVFQVPLLNPIFWQVFFAVFVGYSLLIPFYSPKLQLIADLTSRNKQRVLIFVTMLITLPLYVALCLYAFGGFMK